MKRATCTGCSFFICFCGGGLYLVIGLNFGKTGATKATPSMGIAAKYERMRNRPIDSRHTSMTRQAGALYVCIGMGWGVPLPVAQRVVDIEVVVRQGDEGLYLVRYHHDGGTPARQLPKNIDHAHLELAVDIRRGFVQDKHLGV